MNFDPPIFFLAAIIGLVVGSFLNVVITRGPALWGLTDEETILGSFWGPRSKCPSCRQQIRSWHNIPVVSYIILRGRCADCNASIGARYPLVELLGALSALIAISLFGISMAALFAAIFMWMLIALGFIDFETGYLPDAITFPMIALGLLASIMNLFVSFPAAIIGAFAGYSSFWLIATAYRHLRDREGLGMGDAKLLGALGAWSGWTLLAPIVFTSSLAALCLIAISTMRGREFDSESEIRFGPALAIAGALIFIASNSSIAANWFWI